MKVRIFLFLFLSVILFYPQIQARSNTAENISWHSDECLNQIDAKNKWPLRIADSFIFQHPASDIFDSTYCCKWTREQGTILEALHQLWLSSHETKYLTYIKSNIDMFIGGDGSIRTYNYNDFNLENINAGRQLLFLYSVTKDKKYRMAADTLIKQLKNQPVTKSGGFCDKRSSSQLRLESLNMCEPFYSQYSKMFRQAKNFNEIAGRFILIKEKTLDSNTGLLFPAWDESLQQVSAGQNAGKASAFSAASMGSYAMALVDVLDYFPKSHPKRHELIKTLRDLSESFMKVRNEDSRLWEKIIGQGSGKDNYPEATANCMIGYAFAKGANKGYLNKKYLKFAKEVFCGVVSKFVTVNAMGYIDFHNKSLSKGRENYNIEPQSGGILEGLGSLILLTVELEKGKMLRGGNRSQVKSRITKF